ncbi:MAG: lactate racemase domain-containing protein, partial [Pseudothermotoga sp.]
MKEYKLKFGEEVVSFNTSDDLRIDVLKPNREFDGIENPTEEVRKTLRAPTGIEPLKDLILQEKSKNVVILVSDLTRPCPSHIIVPPLIEELSEAGLRQDQITIVFGLGFHRKMTDEEMKKAVGHQVFEKIKCLNHEISECVFIGKTKRGTPVEVFNRVVESDFIIATGNLELHWFAGYSGGNKALLPGVCSKNTIETNHSYMLL